MTKNRLIIILALVGLLASLIGASLIMRPINYLRSDLQLTVSRDVTANAPPEIALANALGSFRGLGVTALWGRAVKLKDEGKLHEAMQLASWITKLQPRFAQVWAFQGWEMAYNLSVMTHTPQERWMWVRAGIDLLRDEGIPYNPTSVQLYKELSWIFLHKVGQYSDDMHWYYKSKLAEQWDAILGPPPTGSTQDALDDFAPIAEMDQRYFNPDTVAMSVRLDPVPAFKRDNPDAAEAIESLASLGYKLNQPLLLDLSRIQTRREAYEMGILPAGLSPFDSQLDEKLSNWHRSDEFEPVMDRLMAFTRARVLREDFHMNPSFMYELMQGEWLKVPADHPHVMAAGLPDPQQPKPLPLDWRHSAAHGVYWSWLGVEVARGQKNKSDDYYFKVLNTDRQVLHGLQALTHNGRINYDRFSGYFSQLPDPRYIEAYERVFLTASQRIGGIYEKSAAPDSFKAGHENFLSWSTVLAFFYGDRELADSLYARLQRIYANQPNRDHYKLPLDRYVMRQATENMISLDDARQAISGMLRQGIVEGLANGNMEVAENWIGYARYIHDWYQKEQNRQTFNAPRNRMSLRPLVDIYADVMAGLLQMSGESAPMLIKARIWRNAPVEVKLRVFDRIRGPLYEAARRQGLDPAAAFPPPEGIEAYRQAHQQAVAEPDQSTDQSDEPAPTVEQR